MDHVEPLAACEPWAFTQQGPLTTGDFCKQAERRGIHVNNGLLRDLWRTGALAPLVEVRNRPVGPRRPSPIPEPVARGTWMDEFRLARDAGRLADAALLGFRPQLQFERSSLDRKRPWWNGLLYSRWQLLALDRFRGVLPPGRAVQRRDRTPRLRQLSDWEIRDASRMRRLAQLLVALEARYLPEIKRPWVHLTNATFEEWDDYRRAFAPGNVLERLAWAPEELLHAADGLLSCLDRRDIGRGAWTALVRRAGYREWEKLQGEPLAVIDARLAAEILVMCYEDLAARKEVPELTDPSDLFHGHHERLNYSEDSLDGTLASLGLSPHPGVVLVIEGETEEMLVPRVRDRLRATGDRGTVRSVVMRGTKTGLTKLVSFAAGPLIERSEGDHWLLAKPPTRVVVAVDPDSPFQDSVGIERERQKMLDEIVAVTRAQGVQPDPSDVDDLVRIHTWSQSCFEFAHFSDDELSDALHKVHPNCGGLSQGELAIALQHHRQNRNDIKQVWKRWRPQPSKTSLAAELWPVLERHIYAAEHDPSEPVPEVVQRVLEAYHQAQRLPGRWAVRGRSLVATRNDPE